MAPTPTPRSGKDHSTTPKTTTPHSKHRLNFPKTPNPSSAFAPTTPAGSVVPTEHPVEVIGRIREHPPDIQKPNRPSFSSSALNVSEDGRSLRVTTDIGYRDFSLDGVSLAVSEDLSGFYAKFIRSRILDVRTGAKCTVMMYGPTGSGKSHTMFGCGKQPGIVYMALKDILTSGVDTASDDDDDEHLSDEVGLFVQVAVLEIYNEEIYDLLPSSSSAIGSTPGLPKGATPKAKLEVMGKKAKNASYITGNDAGKISREVAKVEKRRIVKSTLCNDRSSRSHCMIILEVPSVGGRLMLVDMAGSENIEQAGQSGFDAKMQTAKINQGNTALKRVVESIANGDSHVPFRDSKLTMLLQDSFEDSRSKILMILCASPDPKELHKTVSTLEYGAKAKCIVRLAKMEATPRGEKSLGVDGGGVGVLGSTIAAMNQFICKLQMENRAKDKEREAVRKELTQKETEVGQLREKLKSVEEKETAAKENEINLIVNEKTVFLRSELQKLEEKMSEQQHELQVLRRLLADAENISDKTSDKDEQSSISSRFLNCFEPEGRMDQSMELDFGGDLPAVLDVKEVVEDTVTTACLKPLSGLQSSSAELLPPKFYLSTVFEEEEEEPTEEIEKEVVEEKNNLRQQMVTVPDTGLIRNTRIQNIFRLCGNYREIAQHKRITPEPAKSEDNEKEMGDKENSQPEEAVGGDDGGKERGKLDPVDSGNCCYLTTNVII